MLITKADITDDRFIIEGIYDHQKFEYIGSDRGTWTKLLDFNGTFDESAVLIDIIENLCNKQFELPNFT